MAAGGALLALWLAAPAAATAPSGPLARLATVQGAWYGVEQRLAALDGRPLAVPESYTPASDLEWGTAPYGFEVAWRLACDGERLVGEHARSLLWSGCFIEGPTQTREEWTSARAPAAVAAGAWAATDGVGTAHLPLPYTASLRILELKGEAPVHLELGLIAAEGDRLSVLQLAHVRPTGALAAPPILTALARGQEGGRRLAAERNKWAARAAEAWEECGACGALRLPDGGSLLVTPGGEPAAEGESAPFAVECAWAGVRAALQWDGRAVSAFEVQGFEG